MTIERGVRTASEAAPSADGGIEWYAAQSDVSDPGALSELLADIPSTIHGMYEVAHQLVLHYRADDPAALGIPRERMREIDTRYVQHMLARLEELQPGSLCDPRPAERRLIGCCRDFALLVVGMSRYHGIPARSRVGFAGYFIAGVALDHEVAEVWDAGDGRWRLVDAELAPGHRDPSDGAHVDPLDVPRDRFLVAGHAWQRCRAGTSDPETFMVGPDVEEPMTRGWPYLQHNLVHDLARLNKRELLLWDGWGLANEPAGPGDLEMLDRIAALTADAGTRPAELRGVYASEPRLTVPATVTSYDPLGGPPRQVRLG